MKKRQLFSTSLIFLMLLPGCNNDNGDKVEITFYGWGNETEVSLTNPDKENSFEYS